MDLQIFAYRFLSLEGRKWLAQVLKIWEASTVFSRYLVSLPGSTNLCLWSLMESDNWQKLKELFSQGILWDWPTLQLWFSGNDSTELWQCLHCEASISQLYGNKGQGPGLHQPALESMSSCTGGATVPKGLLSELSQHGQEPREKAYIHHIWINLR